METAVKGHKGLLGFWETRRGLCLSISWHSVGSLGSGHVGDVEAMGGVPGRYSTVEARKGETYKSSEGCVELNPNSEKLEIAALQNQGLMGQNPVQGTRPSVKK